MQFAAKITSCTELDFGTVSVVVKSVDSRSTGSTLAHFTAEEASGQTTHTRASDFNVKPGLAGREPQMSPK